MLVQFTPYVTESIREDPLEESSGNHMIEVFEGQILLLSTKPKKLYQSYMQMLTYAVSFP